MGLFDRSPAPPAWAQPMFDRKKWRAFRTELVRAVTALDSEAAIDDNAAVVELTIDRARVRVNIRDVALACATNDPADILAQWSDHILGSLEDNHPPETFEEAAPLLRVQLYSDASRPPGARSIAPGLWSSAVVDLPDAIVPVMPVMLESWGVRFEEVLGVALVNTLELPQPSFDDKHAPIRVAHGDEYLAATTFVSLEQLIGDTPHGGLVSFPCRSSALVLPLGEMPSDVALRRIVLATDKLFEGADDPLSRELYWCTADGVVVVSPQRSEAGMMFLWPPGLDDLLQAAAKN